MKRPVFVTFYFCKSEGFILCRYACLSVGLYPFFCVLDNVRFSVCISRSANDIVPIFIDICVGSRHSSRNVWYKIVLKSFQLFQNYNMTIQSLSINYNTTGVLICP